MWRQVIIIPIFYFSLLMRGVAAGIKNRSQYMSKAIVRSVAIALTETTTEVKINEMNELSVRQYIVALVHDANYFCVCWDFKKPSINPTCNPGWADHVRTTSHEF